MNHGELQGWFADPSGLYEQRYFSAGQPTKLVRNGTVESYDEPPSETFDPAEALARSHAYAAGSWQPGAEMSGQLAASGPADTRQRRRGPAIGVFYAIALVAVAAVVAVLIVVIRHGSGSTSRPASMSEVAFVTHSAQRTLAERTADVAISGLAQAAGQTLTLSGTGEIDFSTSAEALTARISTSVQQGQVVEKEIVTHGQVYYSQAVNGVINPVRLLTGRDWIHEPVPLFTSASLTSSDPRAALVLLEQHGDAVRALGAKSLSGVTCTGYAVTPSRQAMTAAEQEESSALKLSPSEAAMLRSIAPPTITVWLDAHGVLHQMSLGLQIGGLTGAAASINFTETFSNYGAPVHIKAPASWDVISYQALKRMAGNSNFDKQRELRLLPGP